MTTRSFSPGDVLFTPPEAATAALAALEYRRAHAADGIYLGIQAIDAHLTPVLSDNLVTILGRPGHGKTGIMLWWARREARRIVASGDLKRVVIYITYEQAVEDLMAFNVAADKRLSIGAMARGTLPEQDWSAALASLTGAVSLPLAIIGHSMERRLRRPRLTLSNVAQTLAYLVDELHLTPHMIFLDYLQRIPGEKYSGDRRLEVSESLDRCKDAALAFGAPWVVGVQARREVDSRDLQIPLLADGQETSNIEQASDKIFSLVRPCKYRKDGESFGRVTVAGNKQMLVSLLKQKLGVDNVSEWIDFDPATNSVEGL
jgi:replicative DNA helicase